MITFLEYLHFMISNQTKLFKYATWKCWARHATWRAPPPARGHVDWRGEWTMVTVSLVICHLATRVRWSFSVFKISHYIDCLVILMVRCGGVSLGDISVSAVASARVTRVQQRSGDTGADVTTWFLHPTSSCSAERVGQFGHRSSSLFTIFKVERAH